MPEVNQPLDLEVTNEWAPQVVIEGKRTEDDRIATHKVTRIQHLSRLSGSGQPATGAWFGVVASLAGPGFRFRRPEMKGLPSLYRESSQRPGTLTTQLSTPALRTSTPGRGHRSVKPCETGLFSGRDRR